MHHRNCFGGGEHGDREGRKVGHLVFSVGVAPRGAESLCGAVELEGGDVRIVHVAWADANALLCVQRVEVAALGLKQACEAPRTESLRC